MLKWAGRMGRKFGQRPSVFLLDPDREAVALDALCEALESEESARMEADIARGSKGAMPVFVVNRER